MVARHSRLLSYDDSRDVRDVRISTAVDYSCAVIQDALYAAIHDFWRTS